MSCTCRRVLPCGLVLVAGAAGVRHSPARNCPNCLRSDAVVIKGFDNHLGCSKKSTLRPRSGLTGVAVVFVGAVRGGVLPDIGVAARPEFIGRKERWGLFSRRQIYAFIRH